MEPLLWPRRLQVTLTASTDPLTHVVLHWQTTGVREQLQLMTHHTPVAVDPADRTDLTRARSWSGCHQI
jgi:hypothetical protein